VKSAIFLLDQNIYKPVLSHTNYHMPKKIYMASINIR